MYAATARGTALGRTRAHPQITARSPNVATNSLKTCAGPVRAWRDAMNSGVSNIRCAAATPPKAPTTCATRYGGTSRQASPPCEASARVTAGLK